MRSISIAAAVTPNLLDKLYVQMNSIKMNKNCQTMVQYYVFIACTAEYPLDACKEYLKDLMSEDFYIHYADATAYKDQIAQRTWIAFIRCLFPRLFLFDRIILYLDTDLVCIQPGLEKLFDEPVDDYYLAAAEDPAAIYSDAGLHDDKNTGNPKYFNSGVMLLNLDRIRKEGKDKELAAWCKAWDHSKLRYTWDDQTLLNYVLKDKVLLVASKWNNQVFAAHHVSQRAFQITAEKEGYKDPLSSIEDTVFVHFCSANKPWRVSFSSGPYAPIYMDYGKEIWEDAVKKYSKR